MLSNGGRRVSGLSIQLIDQFKFVIDAAIEEQAVFTDLESEPVCKGMPPAV
ncbi:MAG: hypothetical protein LBS02_04980 [Hungatella sp.]|jgi:hypothetical protein|nr:hypothetical protein [Hungatella sp.]